MAGRLEKVKDANGRIYYRGKVKLLDDSLVRITIDEAKRYSRTAAKNFLEYAQEQEDKTQTIFKAKTAAAKSAAGEAGETCNDWYARFVEVRRHEVGDVDDDRWRYTKWCAPHIGPKAIREVTADDIENVRDALNLAVLAYEAAGNKSGDGRLAPKTAQNVWAALTTMFKFASTRKGPRELRVREDLGNPCRDMPPPRDGSCKRRHWLRPHQFQKLMACEAIPRVWREAIAIAIFLHLRPGELHELRVEHLDLVAGEVRISAAWNARKKKTTTPKTDEGIRTVTIPPSLMPLLERIARASKPADRVVPIIADTNHKTHARLYRQFLTVAEIDAPEFFVETATHIEIDWRSLRDTGITWRFLAGDRAEAVQREAGHLSIATTLDYAKEVQDRRGRFGTPFPALPFDGPADPSPFPDDGSTLGSTSQSTSGNDCGGAGNRTRVRKPLPPASTCVSNLLFHPLARWLAT